MLVRYSLKSLRSGQITQGEIYFVIEIYFDRKKTCGYSNAYYRIIDNIGCPTIYEADGFEIVSSNLDGYCLAKDDDGDITIAHKLIFEARLNEFWEVYFDDPTNKERTLLENVIKDLSFREGIPAPMLEHREYFHESE